MLIAKSFIDLDTPKYNFFVVDVNILLMNSLPHPVIVNKFLFPTPTTPPHGTKTIQYLQQGKLPF